MKKFLALSLALALTVAGVTACSSKTDDNTADTNNTTTTEQTESKGTIKVGASITPHAEILEAAKDVLKEEGYDLEIVEYNDYVIPNTATESGELACGTTGIGRLISPEKAFEFIEEYFTEHKN